MKLPQLPRIFEQRTLLESREIPTPFGSVSTPSLELPPLRPPKLEDNHRKALAHAVGVDASDLIAMIPYVGTTLADSLRRMHTEEIRKLLTPEEFDKYAKYDRTYPDAIALIRSRIGV